MAGLTEAATWVDEVYQIETTDPVKGGVPNPLTGDGMSNIPHVQLADRTAWLKAQVEAINDGLDEGFAASLSGAGWQKLQSGLIIQWGAAAAPASGSVTVVLPIAFPTAFLQGVVSAGGPSAQGASYGLLPVSTSQISLSNAHPSDVQGLRYIVLGY